jgi:type VI secretion system protein ImpC
VRSALRTPLRVDAADLEPAIASLRPTLRVPIESGGEETFSPRSLDDLHPDRLFERLESFATARQLRRALTVSEARPEVFTSAREWLKEQSRRTQGPAAAEPTAAASVAVQPAGPDSTLERLLGARARPSAASDGALKAILEQAVGQHAAPDVSVERAALLAEIDGVISVAMRRILGSPGYRALESTWRSADRLIRALGSDEELEIVLFDATKAQLAVALQEASAGLEASRLHALLVDGGQRWTLVSCDFTFGADADELSLLAALAATAARAGAVLLADAAPTLFGASSLVAAANPRSWSDAPPLPLWHALRTSPLAPRIGLGFPRVLLRRPFGRKSEPTEAFVFEELDAGPGLRSDERAWGSAAFAIAELLGKRFREQGWEADQGPLELDELPLDLHEQDGERQLTPCTEVALSEQVVTAFVERGIMPLLARRDRPALRLPSVVCVSDPAAPLRLQASSPSGD